MTTQKLPPFDDPRVQLVYELICSEDHPPNKAEHWDGWVSRRIVAALEAAATAPLLERIAELERELAEARKDAGRYRWLRDDAQWMFGVPQAIIWNNHGHVQEICAEEELDSAIDEAMQKGQA